MLFLFSSKQSSSAAFISDSACLHPLPSISPTNLFLFPPSQQGKEDFLQILHRYMEVHGTVYYETQRPPEVPAFVKNHGLLPQNELQQLLRKAKVRLRIKYHLHSARFAVCCPRAALIYL